MALLNKRGFRFAETMSGTFAFVDEPDEQRRFSFSIECVAPSAFGYLRTGKLHMKGTLEADGLASFVPIDGTMVMLPLTHKFIKYSFHFTGDDGMPYTFQGQKDISFLDMRRSFSYLPGEVTNHTGNVIATAKTHFDIKADMFQFLMSWKPA